MARKHAEQQSLCPCGGGAGYLDCCGRYLDSAEPAPTAEHLMRSRYTAFTRGDAEYLLATWHPASRPSRVRLDPAQHWIGLRIMHTDAGGVEDDAGTVEFVARFKEAGRGHRLRELSRFQKIDGRWYYRDGEHR